MGNTNGIIGEIPQPGSKCPSNTNLSEPGISYIHRTCKGISQDFNCSITHKCDPGLYSKFQNSVGTCQPLLLPGNSVLEMISALMTIDVISGIE